MKNLKKVLWATALLGLVICAIIAYNIYQAVFLPNTAFQNKEAFVYINSDSSFEEVKTQLEPLLKDMGLFEAVAMRKGYASNIKGGKYVLKRGMNNNDIVNTLRSKNIPVRVSFNNQETLNALAGRISEQIEPDSLSLCKAFNDASFLSSNGFDADNKLGMYLPNTYEFFWNTTAEGFRDKMLKEYHKFWNDDRRDKAEQLGLEPAEIIALASIVQKETVKVDERPRVAGVYLNRIKRGMLLQADPTVIYAIKKETGNFDTIIKRVLYRDLEINSPYNTYKYAGIPPGPITMPDISSIKAVLNAEKHDYLYFVADVSNFGYHIFAKSLAQHNRNKVQYVRWLNQQQINR
ncbi:Aminodeoxychorismate lyase [Croceitalea dokdonensis DOKDO 023]|uniref:Endolytic murein transglycosylase n=1 Tax=Croceitalea dokdonensis DOKDO 023 TaxID=1300341 RepID=A0A0P7AZK0_9FLAO|nr:endolytic transglycosylase MltG [Croceitalea dokdonensis]KPM33698.1 Aminodeoxychorismate lyase [Croceitalea dokdonensis DOKDO 023]